MAEYDVDKVLVIDNELRTIDIPEDLLLGVESDEAVQKLIFDMPRYYNGIDLSVFAIRVNYMNANNEGDVYVVDSPTIDTERITFTWVVGRQATKYKGDTHFVVCLKKLRQDSTIEKEFNTTVHALPVLVGLETTEAIIEEHPDIFEQLLVNLVSQTNQAVQQITTTGQQYVDLAAASAATATQKAGDASDSATAAAADAVRAETAAASVEVHTNGTYPNMTVGNSQQLVSDAAATDRGIYTFRRNGAISGLSRRKRTKIIGGTVAWNQLVNPTSSSTSTVNGVTYTKNRDGSWTINGTASSLSTGIAAFISSPKNHVYLNSGTPSGVDPNTLRVDIRDSNTNSVIANSADFGGGAIFKAETTSSAWRVSIRVAGGATITNVKVAPQFFDLTQMFGSTIADYIYSLEQANAGAGVAYFRSLFPKPYYDYNAGELMSVKTNFHKTTGFNQWDEEWEIGSISSDTGENIYATRSIRSKNYSPCIPNMNLFFGGNSGQVFAGIRWYGADKDYLGYVSTSDANNRVVTVPDGVHYFRLAFVTTYGTTYNHDICINFSDPNRNGEYEKFTGHSYALDDSLELRGLPKLDSNNELYYDGDVYEADGRVTRKYKAYDFSSLVWTKDESYGFTRFKTTLPDKVVGMNGTLICVPYVQTYEASGANQPDKTIKGGNNEIVVYVRDESYAAYSGAQYRDAMSGVYLVYELAAPTTETADPFAELQVVDPAGTEEFLDFGVSSGARDVAIPVGHETEYLEDLVKKLDDMPKLVAPAIIKNASGAIASFNDGAEGQPLKSLQVAIEPVQDLHGYENPWPEGGGKNKLDLSNLASTAAVTVTEVNNPSYTFVGSGTNVYMNGNSNLKLSASTAYLLSVNTSIIAIRIREFDSDNNLLATHITSGSAVLSFTTDANFDHADAYVVFYTVPTTATTITPMLRLATESDGTFAPYSNICPISGWTGANVSVTGINVWDEEWELGSISSTTGELTVSSTNIRSKNRIPVYPSTSYRFLYTDGATNVVGLHAYDANDNWLGMYNPDNGSWRTTGEGIGYITGRPVFTTPANAAFIRFRIGGRTTYTEGQISINTPSTVTDYMPFGTTYPVTWESQAGEVFGGTIDVVSGELKVTHGWREADGTEAITGPVGNSGEYQRYYFTSGFPDIVAGSSAGFVSCSHLKSDGSAAVTSGSIDRYGAWCTVFNGNVRLGVPFATPALFKQWLADMKTAGTPVQFAYALATPVIYQLTPTEVKTLLGDNNVWSNTGDVELEYSADTGLVITGKVPDAPTTDGTYTLRAIVSGGKPVYSWVAQ